MGPNRLGYESQVGSTEKRKEQAAKYGRGEEAEK